MKRLWEKSSSDIEIRLLTDKDITELMELERRCFSSSWQEEQFHRVFQQPVFFVIGVFLKNAGLIGYISAYHLADELEIVNIAVSHEHRRKKLGLRLLTAALCLGKAHNATRAVLEVRTSNVAAIALYERLNFRHSGVRPNYYEDTGEDALVYVANLE